AALVANLKGAGFAGPIYPINPSAGEIQGLRAYPRVSAAGQRVDLAVIAVPAPAVEEVVRDCAAAGVRDVVVISAGFAEASEEGRAAQQRLTRLGRAAGLRLVGARAMRARNTDPAGALHATFPPP